MNDTISREKELKGWKRDKKIELIKNTNQQMRDLSEELFNDFSIDKEEINQYINDIRK